MIKGIEYHPSELTLTTEIPASKTLSTYFNIFEPSDLLLASINEGSYIIAEFWNFNNSNEGKTVDIHLSHPFHSKIEGKYAYFQLVKSPARLRYGHIEQVIQEILKVSAQQSEPELVKWYSTSATKWRNNHADYRARI